MLWILRRTWREQREIRYLMRDFRTGTAKAILILLAAAAVLWGLVIALVTYGWI